jgi:hypothetical protein
LNNETKILRELLDTLRSSPDIPKVHVAEFLKNSSGDIDAVTDYSGTPVQYFYQPAAAKNVAVTDLTVQITHGSCMHASLYGGLTALSPGLELKVLAASSMSNTNLDLLDGEKITKNLDWTRIAQSAAAVDYGSTIGGKTFVAHLKWNAPVVLHGADSDRLAVIPVGVCNALTAHSFFMQGYEF